MKPSSLIYLLLIPVGVYLASITVNMVCSLLHHYGCWDNVARSPEVVAEKVDPHVFRLDGFVGNAMEESLASPAFTERPIVELRSQGGYELTAQRIAARLAEESKIVQVSTRCESACVMMLTAVPADHRIIAPEAVLMFHQGRSVRKGLECAMCATLDSWVPFIGFGPDNPDEMLTWAEKLSHRLPAALTSCRTAYEDAGVFATWQEIQAIEAGSPVPCDAWVERAKDPAQRPYPRPMARSGNGI